MMRQTRIRPSRHATLLAGLAVLLLAGVSGAIAAGNAASENAEPGGVSATATTTVPVGAQQDAGDNGNGNDNDVEAVAETRLRFSQPSRGLSLRFSGRTDSTIRLTEGRKPKSLTPRLTTTTDFEVAPRPASEGRSRIGFSITGLTFQYRDEEHTKSFSLGEGRGPDGEDGLSTQVDGARDRTIPELDWGGDGTELPPTFGRVIATARLNATGGLREIASRLPDVSPARRPDDFNAGNASLLVYQNPAELAALYYVPLPVAPLESLADTTGTATWTATIALPPLFGEPARDVEFRFTANAADAAAGPVEITFEPVNQEALPQGQTLSGTLTIDPTDPTAPHRITYTIKQVRQNESHQTTWRIAPR